jgi:hypothetical protein
MRQRLAVGVAVGLLALVVLATMPAAADGDGVTLAEFLYGIASAFGDVAEFVTSFADFLSTDQAA